MSEDEKDARITELEDEVKELRGALKKAEKACEAARDAIADATIASKKATDDIDEAIAAIVWVS